MDNHLILTRFNKHIGLIRDPQEIHNLFKGNPSWIDERINLFKKYYIPSFLNQTDTGHHNFILCDSSTPNKYKKIFKDLEKDYPFLNFIYNTELAFSKKTYNSVLNQYKIKRKNTSDIVITSRLDNDDMVSKFYNQSAKECLETRDWITFSDGICINHFNYGQVTHFRFPKSPFVSQKVNIKNFDTPLSTNHHDVPSESIYTNIPMWAQVIHNSNLDNKLRGSIINLSPGFLKDNFNLV